MPNTAKALEKITILCYYIISKLKELGIDSSKFTNPDKKQNNADLLEAYNNKRKKDFDDKQNEKLEKEKAEFIEKYMTDEYMWEFETLSMFITNNPLKEVANYVTNWDEVNEGAEGVLLAVVINLTRKKDKNNNVFAYIDLYTINGIIEAVAWASKFKTYEDFLQKGKCITLLGRKGENSQMFIKEVKDFQDWLQEKNLK